MASRPNGNFTVKVLVYTKPEDEMKLIETNSGATVVKEHIGTSCQKKRNFEKEAEDKRQRRLCRTVNQRAKKLKSTYHIYSVLRKDGSVTFSGNQSMLSSPEFCHELQSLLYNRALQCKLLDSQAVNSEEDEEKDEEQEEEKEEEKDIRQILSQIDIKKLSCQDMKKLISQLVIHSDVKNPRSIWGVDKHKPCWWPKSQKFDTPWKIKDNQCVYHKNDALEILSSALEWYKSNFKKTELK